MTAKKIKVTRWLCVCERCGTKWISRDEAKPMTCAACRSPYWNKERKQPFTPKEKKK